MNNITEKDRLFIFDCDNISHLHACVKDVSGESKQPEELINIINNIPINIINDAKKHGMNDVIWQEMFCNWYEGNKK